MARIVVSRLYPWAAVAALAACSAVAIGAAQADELRPIQARSIALGAVSGVAYYTAEAAGDRIVATLSTPDATHPIRVVAMLTPGQSMILSVPRGPGEQAIEVAFTRRGDRVFVSNSNAMTN